MKILSFLAILVLSAGVARAQNGPVVTIISGAIRGTLTADGGAAFKGIPYASPPVGDLRWRPPQATVPWQGVRDATKFGAPCTQLSESWNEQFVSGSSEDCLYLNVAVSQWPPKANYPVMVWIHGGSNTAGDGDDAGFDERTLVHRGVILVTINYRLGALGFLSHPELDDESPMHTSGNYGLMDQMAALRWVQANILLFGGDTEKVTVFGESAGAFDIGLLMSSPLAPGLFRAGIAESGAVSSFHGPRTKAQAEEIGKKLAALLKAPDVGAVAFLRKVPAETILKEAQVAAGGDRTGLETSLDGWVLPESPAAVFASGGSLPVLLLIGSNAQEIPGPEQPEQIRSDIRKSYGDLAERALQLYGLSGEGVGDTDSIYGGAGIQWATDTGFRCPSTEEAIWQSAAGRPTYQYEFEHAKPGQEYTSHNSELSFLFATWGKDVQLSAMDKKISEQMQAYWTNFARTGDPNGEGLPAWPKFTKDAQGYMAFTDNGAVAKAGLRRTFCELWQQSQSAHTTK